MEADRVLFVNWLRDRADRYGEINRASRRPKPECKWDAKRGTYRTVKVRRPHAAPMPCQPKASNVGMVLRRRGSETKVVKS